MLSKLSFFFKLAVITTTILALPGRLYSANLERCKWDILALGSEVGGYRVLSPDKNNRAAVADLIYQAFSNYRQLGIPFKTAFLSKDEIANQLNDSTVILGAHSGEIAASVRVNPVELGFGAQSEFEFNGDRYRRTDFDFGSGIYIHISSLSGSPDFLGGGSILLDHIENVAKGSGFSGLSLVTANAPGSEKVYRFYQRLGFKTIGTTFRLKEGKSYKFELMVKAF